MTGCVPSPFAARTANGYAAGVSGSRMNAAPAVLLNTAPTHVVPDRAVPTTSTRDGRASNTELAHLHEPGTQDNCSEAHTTRIRGSLTDTLDESSRSRSVRR